MLVLWSSSSSELAALSFGAPGCSLERKAASTRVWIMVSTEPAENSDGTVRNLRPALKYRTPLAALRADGLQLHDTTGDDLGLIEHPASNVQAG